MNRPSKAALDKLFVEVKIDKTPMVVGRIGADIAEMLDYVRFSARQNTKSG